MAGASSFPDVLYCRRIDPAYASFAERFDDGKPPVAESDEEIRAAEIQLEIFYQKT